MLIDFNQKKKTKAAGSKYEVYSPKLDRVVILGNELEYKNWLLIESNPDILEFNEKPVRINYCENGISSDEYVLDMWVKKKNGSVGFIKLKSDLASTYKANSKQHSNEYEVGRAWCSSFGFEYSIVTESELDDNQVYLKNLKEIIAAVSKYKAVVETDIKNIRNLLEKNKRINIKELIISLDSVPSARIKEAVYWLIYTGEVSSDIKIVPLSEKTNIWAKKI